MFDAKIILFLVPLAVLLYFAYTEISGIKENMKSIAADVKNQTDSITQNVNQCVERIEKISQTHINEIQTINKINLQQINRMHSIRGDEDVETEGLSNNYLSPTMKEQIVKTKPKINIIPKKVASPKRLDDLYLSDIEDGKKSIPLEQIVISDVVEKQPINVKPFELSRNDINTSQLLQNIPIYTPQEIQNDDSEDDESEECDDENEEEYDDSEDIDYQPNMNINMNELPEIQKIFEIFNNAPIQLSKLRNSGPLIESIHSDIISEVQIKDQNISNHQDTQSSISSKVSEHLDILSNQLSQSEKIPDTVSVKSVSSHKSMQSIKSNTSVKSNKSSKLSIPLDIVEQDVRSSKSNTQPITEIQPILKEFDAYNFKELQNIAKQHNIPLSDKIDGKTRLYKKQELYNILQEQLK